MGFRGFVVALAMGVVMVFAAPALAATAGTVTATGTGQAKVTPSDRHSNASIITAVDAARSVALKGAFSQAREYAHQYAADAGLTLGGVLSVSDALNNGFGPSTFYGPFGPNAYCGKTRQPIFKRVHGHRRITGFKSVHRCFVPQFAYVTLSVTYNAS
jgi:uncharacterized protein YggE